MGAGGSKPGWYPGEPAVETLAECSCAAIAFDTHCENSKSNGCSGQQTNMLKASTAPASNDNSHPSRHRRLPASISSRDRYSLPLINLVNREVRANRRLPAPVKNDERNESRFGFFVLSSPYLLSTSHRCTTCHFSNRKEQPSKILRSRTDRCVHSTKNRIPTYTLAVRRWLPTLLLLLPTQ